MTETVTMVRLTEAQRSMLRIYLYRAGVPPGDYRAVLDTPATHLPAAEVRALVARVDRSMLPPMDRAQLSRIDKALAP